MHAIDLAGLYQGTVETWTARVEAVGPDQWDAPTPCSSWTVRELVNHVVGEDAWTVPLVKGSSIAEVGDTLDGDLLGDDPVDTAVRCAAEAAAVVAHKLPKGGVVQLSYGEESIEEYIHQLAADHLIHAWDLAAATGGDTSLDPALVDAVAAWFADREELYRSAGAIGERVDAPEDAQSQLLAGSGRSPSWTPPQR